MSEELSPPTTDEPAENSGEYVVVARRYRPKNFTELVGQSHVAQALCNAIQTQRVGHAYLFTGARGVGKTSTARIFAKALNNPGGPNPDFDNSTDLASSIDAGEDVDVLEIDGASNRGIDEIRQLRQNAGVRPSRARYKIYIIDEVHMLTTAAFNALLKTLEEPPEHVKFILCTTDPEKMPITVLSRCQRFDFAPVEQSEIVERLEFIVQRENMQADREALELLARRARGSMRDSQSLLEQLLSFCEQKITLADVHSLLGTAETAHLARLVERLAARDAGGALTALQETLSEGADPGQLTEQLLQYMRDMMTAVAGCSVDLLLQASPEEHAGLREQGQALGMNTLLAILQILDQSIVRMRQSMHSSVLLEMALVRICNLEELDELPRWVAALQDGRSSSAAGTNSAAPAAAASSPPPAPSSPAPSSPAPSSPAPSSPAPSSPAPSSPAPSSPAPSSPAPSSPAPSSPAPAPAASPSTPTSAPTSAPATSSPSTPPPAVPPLDPPPTAEKKTKEIADTSPKPPIARSSGGGLSPGNINHLWRQALDTLGDMTADAAQFCTTIAISAPNSVVATFPAQYNHHKTTCERPERKSRLEKVLSDLAGTHVHVEFRVDGKHDQAPAPVAKPRTSIRDLQKEKENDPFVVSVMETFQAEVIRVVPPRPPAE